MPVLIGYVIGKVAAQWVLIWRRALSAVFARTETPSARQNRWPSALRQHRAAGLLAVGLALMRTLSGVGLGLAVALGPLAAALWIIVPGPPFAHAFAMSVVLGLGCFAIRCASVKSAGFTRERR